MNLNCQDQENARPGRFEVGAAEPEFSAIVERSLQEDIKFEALDSIISCFKGRFDQPWPKYRIYKNLLLKTVNK